jgi:transcriptional regulator with XRE-family HTH domain
MSQEFLGKMIGATQQTVSRWEKGLGAPEAVYRRALADVLGVEPAVWAIR